MDNKIVSFESRAIMGSETGSTTTGHNADFLPIDFPKKRLKDEVLNTYHVYSSKTEFKIVEAQTAAMAIQLSGITNPVKVARTNSDLGNILDNSIILENEPAAGTAATSPQEAPPPPTPEPPPQNPENKQ